MDILNNSTGYQVSDRYKPISSGELCNKLIESGFTIRDLQKARVNKPEKQGYQRHIIRAQHNDLKMLNDGLRPELVIRNSYDGSQALKINLGVFRLVCCNGLVVGNSYKSVRIIHTGNAVSDAISSLNDFIKIVPEVTKEINEMNKVILSRYEQLRLASNVIDSIIPQGTNHLTLSLNDLLKVNRPYDEPNDIWTTLNRIQENALRGGITYEKRKDNKIQFKKTRPIKSIERRTTINQLVWTKASELLAVA